MDKYIEELALAGKPPDGMPHLPGKGSKTENIAFSFRERMEAEQKRLRADLLECQYYIGIYDAVLKTLDPTENWIVDSHYMQSLSFNEMLRNPPDTQQIMSRSKLYRMKRLLLEKIDEHLQVVGDSFGMSLHAAAQTAIQRQGYQTSL